MLWSARLPACICHRLVHKSSCARLRFTPLCPIPLPRTCAQFWPHLKLLEQYLRSHRVQLAVLRKSDKPEAKRQALHRCVGCSPRALLWRASFACCACSQGGS